MRFLPKVVLHSSAIEIGNVAGTLVATLLFIILFELFVGIFGYPILAYVKKLLAVEILSEFAELIAIFSSLLPFFFKRMAFCVGQSRELAA